MRLDEFEVGDKVTDHKTMDDPLDQRSPFYEVQYIGKEYVILLGTYGDERVAVGTTTVYSAYIPMPTYNELRERVELLAMLGDDLVAAIRNAAWDQDLSSPTYHMRSAADRWEDTRRV